MELEFVDALAVAHVVLDAVHRGRVEDADDAAEAGSGQERFPRFGIVRPVQICYGRYWTGGRYSEHRKT